MPAAEQQAYVAVLNSAFFTWYFRTVVPRKGRLFAELKINHLVDFPIPEPNRWSDAIVSQLASLSRRAAQSEIDLMTAKLFSLSARESRIVR